MRSDRKRAPLESWKHLDEALATLKLLVSGYDAGTYGTAGTIAVTVHRILTDILTQLGVRREISFVSTAGSENPRNLMPESPLSGMSVHLKAEAGGVPDITVTFYPVGFEARLPHPARQLPFGAWWNEVVIRGGAGENGLIPTDPALQIPRDARPNLSRFRLVQLVRNKLGAHSDANVPILLELIEDARFFGMDFAVQTPQKTYSIFDTPDRYTFVNTVMDATVRQIAGELLQSFNSASSAATLSQARARCH